MNDFDRLEFATNPDPRCPCLLLLDTSGSMSGSPINELNRGLQTFQRELQQDELASRRVEVALITFGNVGVQVKQEFATADQFTAPSLSADGDTPLGAAINRGLDLLRQRKDTYRQAGVAYYRPWVFMITDTAGEWLIRSDSSRVHQSDEG